MDVMAAEEVAAVATIRRTLPAAQEAVVEAIGHNQQRLDLIKSWKATYLILANNLPQICWVLLR